MQFAACVHVLACILACVHVLACILACVLPQVGEDANAQEEDSDAEICYSTDWETSSNGEEGEDEEEEGEAASRVPHPPRSKTYHIAQEILSTEQT